ncbi:hypothetical protein M0802_003260 [Mischocyttarus mexicanus]|nr:hypothetical protein M0802_003260 [Mischocyttarus mexicanus]
MQGCRDAGMQGCTMSRLKLANKLARVVRRYYEQVLSTITRFRVSFQQSAHSKVLEVIDASEAHNGGRWE